MTTEDYRKKSPIVIFLNYFKNHKGLFFLDVLCAHSGEDLLKALSLQLSHGQISADLGVKYEVDAVGL